MTRTEIQHLKEWATLSLRSSPWTAGKFRAFRTRQLLSSSVENGYYWAHRLAKRGSAVIDVGANVGQVTSVLADAVGPSGLVLSLEPNPHCFMQLLAGKASNVVASRVAAGPDFADVVLSVPVDDSGRSQEQLGSLLVPAAGGGVQEYRVPQIPLDALVACTPLDFSLIKIDVEGFELGVLEGAADLIGRFKPSIVVEVEERNQAPGRSVNDVFELLVRWGYEVSEVSPDGLMPLAAFDSIRDQRQHLDGQRVLPGYVNNFVAVSRSGQ